MWKPNFKMEYVENHSSKINTHKSYKTCTGTLCRKSQNTGKRNTRHLNKWRELPC